MAEKEGPENAPRAEIASQSAIDRRVVARAAMLEASQARSVADEAQVKLLAEYQLRTSPSCDASPKTATAARAVDVDPSSRLITSPSKPSVAANGRHDARNSAIGAAEIRRPASSQVVQVTTSNKGAMCSLNGRNRIDVKGCVWRWTIRTTSSWNSVGLRSRSA